LFFLKSLHYGSKLSPQAKEVIDTLRDTQKLDTQAESQLQIMEKQIELLEEVDSSFESTENESQSSMSRILSERRLEWRTLIAKVDTMVNQYNEIPSLLETFDKKYDDVGIWIQSVESCQKQLEQEQNVESLASIKENLNVSFIFVCIFYEVDILYLI
jgi:predicted ATPase